MFSGCWIRARALPGGLKITNYPNKYRRIGRISRRPVIQMEKMFPTGPAVTPKTAGRICISIKLPKLDLMNIATVTFFCNGSGLNRRSTSAQRRFSQPHLAWFPCTVLRSAVYGIREAGFAATRGDDSRSLDGFFGGSSFHTGRKIGKHFARSFESGRRGSCLAILAVSGKKSWTLAFTGARNSRQFQSQWEKTECLAIYWKMHFAIRQPKELSSSS
jgi:hypothetical protein